MGVVTQRLAAAAMAAGASIHTACPVARIEVQDGQATGAGVPVQMCVCALRCFPLRTLLAHARLQPQHTHTPTHTHAPAPGAAHPSCGPLTGAPRATRASGLQLAGGGRVDARVVLVNADPFRLRALAGAQHFAPTFNAWLDSLRKDGTTMKVACVLCVCARVVAAVAVCGCLQVGPPCTPPPSARATHTHTHTHTHAGTDAPRSTWR
jgi:hypothetical protein